MAGARYEERNRRLGMTSNLRVSDCCRLPETNMDIRKYLQRNFLRRLSVFTWHRPYCLIWLSPLLEWPSTDDLLLNIGYAEVEG